MPSESRDHETSAVFTRPGTYPGLPPRAAQSLRLSITERHHLMWRSWSIFQEGSECHVRRIEWPCAMGARGQTGQFTRTFAAEARIDGSTVESMVEGAAAALAAAAPSHDSAAAAPSHDSAVAIDGCTFSLRVWQAGVFSGIDWAAPIRPSAPDRFVASARVALDAVLPASSADRFYDTLDQDMPAKDAARPR